MTFIKWIFAFLLIFECAYAAKLKPINVPHQWKKSDTVRSAILTHIDTRKISEKNISKLVKYNIKKNSLLNKPDKIPVGKIVKLKIPKLYLVENFQEEKKFKQLNFLLYTLSSLGTFSEKSDTYSYSAKWGQNSPLTVGAGFNYYLEKDSLNAISAGFYYSYFLPSESTDPELQNIKSLNEYGFVFHYQAAPDSLPFLTYGGIDYESFSTINTAELIRTGPTIDPIRHNLIFATIGLGYNFSIGKKNLSTKISLSQTITSSTSREIFNGGSLKGQKILTSVTYNITKHVMLGVIYKKHILENKVSEVGVSRFGFTIGYAF